MRAPLEKAGNAGKEASLGRKLSFPCATFRAMSVTAAEPEVASGDKAMAMPVINHRQGKLGTPRMPKCTHVQGKRAYKVVSR